MEVFLKLLTIFYKYFKQANKNIENFLKDIKKFNLKYLQNYNLKTHFIEY